MYSLIITAKDLTFLKKIASKNYSIGALSSKEKSLLGSLFSKISLSNEWLSHNFYPHKLEVKIFDIQEVKPQLKKWCNLFNNLPKNGDDHLPYSWFKEDECLKNNTIITVAFIPSFLKSKEQGLNRIINVDLKIDGTAIFKFNNSVDTNNFPELYNFKGSWKEAYFLVVKTLKQGWPQTKFPKEFDQLLKE